MTQILIYFITFQLITGWVDDSVFTRRNQENDEEVWSNGGSGSHTGSGAFTTGRQRARPQPPAPPVKPRSQVCNFHFRLEALFTNWKVKNIRETNVFHEIFVEYKNSISI